MSDVALFARAHGVAARLLSRSGLDQLAEAPDLPALTGSLMRLGPALEPIGDQIDLAGIERAIRRTAARDIRILNRWQQRRPGSIDIVLADLDRRSLRALVRGATEGAPPSLRLAGLTPTPRLPERVLVELARQPSPGAVVGALTMLGDPDAAALAPLVADTHPDLFAVEAVLLARWAQRARLIARRAGRLVRDLVAERIDVGNAQLAFLTAGTGTDTTGAFVPGGTSLAPRHIADAAAAATARDAMKRLRAAALGTPLGEILSRAAPEPAALERAWIVNMLARLARQARLEPVGPAHLLHTLLRIDAQAHDLRALVWGAALGAPHAARLASLVTP